MLYWRQKRTGQRPNDWKNGRNEALIFPRNLADAVPCMMVMTNKKYEKKPFLWIIQFSDWGGKVVSSVKSVFPSAD